MKKTKKLMQGAIGKLDAEVDSLQGIVINLIEFIIDIRKAVGEETLTMEKEELIAHCKKLSEANRGSA